MYRMKKYLFLILIIILAFSIVGCGDNKEDVPGENNPEEEEPEESPSKEPELEEHKEVEEAEEPEEKGEIDLNKYYNMGKDLYDLGLFGGVSESEYVPNLEGSMNRQEAMKMIVSALGWKAADEEDNPFVDVSDWAKPYVARAYMEGIALGTVPEQSIFGAEDSVSKIQLLTFYLRALDYESTYAYDNAERLGEITGISNNLSGARENLKRYDLVAVTYDTLKTSKRYEDISIIEKLTEEGIVNLELAKEKGLISKDNDKDQEEEENNNTNEE